MRQIKQCAAMVAALLAFALLGCEPHYPPGYDPPGAGPVVPAACPDSPCEAGQVCVDGLCVAEIADAGVPAVCPAAPCGDGLVCVEGACVAPPADAGQPPADAGNPACVAMCHRPESSGEAPHAICVDPEAVPAHRSHGDTVGDCAAPPDDGGLPPDDEPGNGSSCDDGKIAVCHVPPGNPANAHTICVGAKARDAHLKHGDTLGPCGQMASIVRVLDVQPAVPNLRPLFDFEQGYKISYSDLVFRPNAPIFKRLVPLHGTDVPKLPSLPKQRLPLHSPKK